jgi:hypothetical protein
MHAGVDQRRALVVDQELIELKRLSPSLGSSGRRDSVDPVHDLVDARHAFLLFRPDLP